MCCAMTAYGDAGADSDAVEALAKAAQNPISNLMSLPFQDNTSYRVGSSGQTQNVLNIEPVIPFQLNDDWNLITRTIIPVVSQPNLAGSRGQSNGLGDINPSFFFSPRTSNVTIWGIGPSFFMPTATQRMLGSGKWSVGPGLIVVSTPGHWVLGALVSNVWSFAGQSDRERFDQLTAQPFVNYNVSNGWYVSSSPIITADWAASPGNKWLVPMGGGFGRVFMLGQLYLNAETQVFYNVMTPDNNGSRWSTRFQLKLLFPR